MSLLPRREELAFVRGLGTTRLTLERWNAAPGAVLVPWVAVSVAIGVGLLFATWWLALVVSPYPGGLRFPGIGESAGLVSMLAIVGRNLLVLALHGLACVAGYIAGSQLPVEAERYGPRLRTLHDRAGRLAMLFVAAATLFSLSTQAWALGHGAATLAGELHISPALLLLGLAPHALPELAALFLPLAAWLMASRRGAWDELLAATLVTVALAVPVLVAASAIETYLSSHVLLSLAGR